MSGRQVPHEPSVGESAAERREPGARGVATVDASRRLKWARVKSNASQEIAIVRAEHAAEDPFDFRISRTLSPRSHPPRILRR